MPARNIKGMFPSQKMGGPIYFESLIERDFIYLLEYETAVTHFKEQPFTIRYPFNGRSHRYTPDFYFLYADKEVVAECKPANRVNKPDNQRKFNAAHAWCGERGSAFMVVTDEALRQGCRLRNIKDMHNFSRYVIAEAEKTAVTHAIASLGHVATIGDVLQRISPEQPLKTMTTILHMGWHKEVCLPLDDAPITSDSPIWLPDSPHTGEAACSLRASPMRLP